MPDQCVVKTCRRDLHSYLELQHDLSRFGYGEIRLCVPEEDLEVFGEVAAPGVELITCEVLLTEFGYSGQLRENWYTQQLFKLLLAASSTSEVCWILDANTVLLRPLPSPVIDGRIVLWAGHLNAEDRQCYAASARFLGLSNRGPTMATVNQSFGPRFVREMLSLIGRRSGDDPVEALVAAMVAGRCRDKPAWTEFGLYRAFAAQIGSAGHVFGKRRPMAYYRHDCEGRNFETFLCEIARRSVSMVKVYAHRPEQLAPAAIRTISHRIRCAGEGLARLDG